MGLITLLTVASSEAWAASNSHTYRTLSQYLPSGTYRGATPQGVRCTVQVLPTYRAGSKKISGLRVHLENSANSELLQFDLSLNPSQSRKIAARFDEGALAVSQIIGVSDVTQEEQTVRVQTGGFQSGKRLIASVQVQNAALADDLRPRDARTAQCDRLTPLPDIVQ